MIETKTYSDGTIATGVAPLPDQSPARDDYVARLEELARQAAFACEMVPHSVRNGDHISLPRRIRALLACARKD